MKIKFSDLWRIDGTIGRTPYALFGILLFAVKHNLDRFIASHFFGRPWGLFSYLVPSGKPSDTSFYGTLLLVALPFIWIGATLTLKRLRSVRLAPALVLLFFVPFVNLALFAMLSILPERSDEEPHSPKTSPFRAYFDLLIPNSALGSAAFALMIATALAAVAAQFSIQTLTSYGLGLFVGLPFALGLGSVLIYGYHRPRPFGTCLSVANLSVLLVGIMFMAIAAEGAICLVMAAPIGFFLASLGGAVGFAIQKRPWAADDVPPLLILLIVFVPGIMGAEHRWGDPAEIYSVTSFVEINAPPETVWRHVVTFSQLPPPHEALFKMGIAYPIRAEMQGRGVGAVRRCQFSTGPFVEPIQVWDEPRLLKFSVTSNPEPMQEWTPYRAVHPRHLDGFFVSHGGQFRLIRLPGNRTRLEGTTWYQHHLHPGAYWKLWSDAIIHRIHLRVLNHVRRLSES